MGFANASDGTFEVPTHLFSDYVELGLLITVLAVGAPLNAVALDRLYRAYQVRFSPTFF